MESRKFENMKDAKEFTLAGNAYLTLKSMKSGNHLTFRIRRNKYEGQRIVYFVSFLRGPDNTSDYTYIGYITQQGEFLVGRKSKISADAAPVRAFRYFWNCGGKQIPDQLEVWHEGKCGRCGRLLTEPESLARGIGPVCAEREQKWPKN